MSIAITPSGSALRLFSGKTKLMTLENIFDLQTNACLSIFAENRTELEKKRINIVLSHHFVRFVVLPWQQGIYSRQDWQAIAKHRFKKNFGSIANDWEVEVAFSKFGGLILASAINKDYLEKLDTLAQRIGFQLQLVSPLIEKFTQYVVKWPTAWLLVVEPERILLSQYHQAICQRLTMESPPAGYEYMHAKQLLKRMFLKDDLNESNVKVLTFVSSALQAEWPDTADHTLDQCLMVNNRLLDNVHHAVWMADL